MTNNNHNVERHVNDELHTLVDELPIGITAVSTSGLFNYTNKAGVVHSGLPADQEIVELEGRILQITQVTVPIGADECHVKLSYDITEQRQLEDDLYRRAYFDELTGLPNRSMIERTVAAVTGAENASFALAFIDLDHFKDVNDYYGHTIADQLLTKIAERLSAELRPSDMLARVGGDEFVLLLSPATNADEIALLVQKFSSRLKQPFFIDGYEILTSASIGVSIYPDNGASFEELYSKADQAMYDVKNGARGGAQLFDSNTDKATNERMKLEQRLRLAVRDQRLCCAYQPKVDFRSGEVVGIEVLLRWRDEYGDIQPPGDFVTLAVELGLMDEITLLVLSEIAAARNSIDEAFGPEVSISINVAARQADKPDFMRSFLEAIVATGMAKRFIIEVTEEAFLQKSKFQAEVLPMIRNIGARVSIDDFGTGYSSLSALADITADEIKVDRSFITDIHLRPRSQSVLKAIESLADALDMSIIVEGVETFEELLYLQASTRIRLAQGYYFAKPIILEQAVMKTERNNELRKPAEPTRVEHKRVNYSRS
ncbi:bifunctional diguanylate cyclase/phosphodiesterase [Ahrensia sp. 13_GOM-1096m]|uniref:putative bifunctional diguanylate cyclase/phosphodiesterase n=1 Tax=Ahrensia sp. 13_GOM-1096m TaxID=1380380 RepID=UPI000AAA163A|nr:EAL domain-containing protein [Ahrensia sp. 13_GOM-1096m]